MKSLKIFVTAIIVLAFINNSNAHQFIETPVNIEVESSGKVLWADFNNDGYLDFIFFSSREESSEIKIYINDKVGGFFPLNFNFPEILCGSFYLTDFNNNGLIDIIVNGKTPEEPSVILFKNVQGGNFEELILDIPGTIQGSIVAEDLNNDGRKDLLITGLNSLGFPVTSIYLQRVNMTFDILSQPFIPVYMSTVAVYDINNSGQPDIFISGKISDNGCNETIKSYVYANVNGVFTLKETSIPGFAMASADWGDYNNDGLADLIITGQVDCDLGNPSSVKTKIFKNEGDFNFTDVNANLSAYINGNVQWGDYNNDGLLDIFISGKKHLIGQNNNVNIYQNNSNSFIPLYSPLFNSLNYSFGAWGDFDNDGDLDIVYVSSKPNANTTIKVVVNNSEYIGNIPIEPNGLTTTVEFNHDVDGTLLIWNYPFEVVNQNLGMTFNVRVGTSPGASDIVSPNSNTYTGKLLIPNTGNAGNSTRWIIRNLPNGKYYWSVQAVDQAFQGSLFAPEQTFYVTSSTSVSLISDIVPDDFTLNQNYPNPFNPVTKIRFSIPDISDVSLKIYNSLGKLVSEPVSEILNKGEYEVVWNGTDVSGSILSSGVYFYSLTNGKSVITKRMVLLK